ncbi:hypothetical protein AQ750_20295 [Burkholderia pseudomallei]|uniref:Hypothetical phage protein n=1 Tax=Burkholderia pseudomallei (strain K96243) TaxID=272560 RepID=Q63XG4_BURPS|nr:hypothetical protein AQ727_26110 [Burkholderia pseudomallei]CAH34565.1 hypothetical phage protein [Burkholderia pseudomallei K96243]OMS19702.1 hypothetical protein AQ736_01305 [Burkholderia pseudomallei]OMS35773.1 hypothetical protein AQ739_29240 [Burkholderia pseudomallei]OMS99989.1 hypothetical protein AQ752_29640 [Burkholderia pseudomallei]
MKWKKTVVVADGREVIITSIHLFFGWNSSINFTAAVTLLFR